MPEGAQGACRRERLAGLGIAGLLAVLAVSNLVWIGGHCGELRPYGPGDPAPRIVLLRADGLGTGDLAALSGRVVLIDFWATWCGPCLASMPIVERVYRRHRAEGLEVLSVNIDGGRDAAGRARAFARRQGLEVPVVVDDGRAAAAYRVSTIPHLVLVDRAGIIRGVELGVPDERALDAEVQALLRAR